MTDTHPLWSGYSHEHVLGEATEAFREVYGRHFEHGPTVDALKRYAEEIYEIGRRAGRDEVRREESAEEKRRKQAAIQQAIDDHIMGRVMGLLALVADEVPITTLDVMVDVAPLVDAYGQRYEPLVEHLLRELSEGEMDRLAARYEPDEEDRPDVVYRDRVITRRKSSAGAFALGFFLGGA